MCDYNPGEVKGGILADAMGLGKSLSLIALLATDWPRQRKGLWVDLADRSGFPTSNLGGRAEETHSSQYPYLLETPWCKALQRRYHDAFS